MAVIAYTYSGYVEVDGCKVLKAPYLSRHVFTGGEHIAPRHARLCVFSCDGPGARYEVCPVGDSQRAADAQSPKIENGQAVLIGEGWVLSVWEKDVSPPLPAAVEGGPGEAP